MKYIYILILLVLWNKSYCHIDLFKLSDCKFEANQKLSYSYSYDVKFENTGKIYFLKEVGINYFNVGDDEYSNINLTIYNIKDLSKPLFSKDTIFREVFDQTAFFKTLLFLSGGNEYKIIIKPNESLNDDLINLIIPKNIPYYNQEFSFRINNIKKSDISSNNYENTEKCPLLNLGINNQDGINIISEQIINYKKIISANSTFVTEFKTLEKKISINSVQFYLLKLDSDKILNIKLKIENKSKNLLKYIDTIINEFDSTKNTIKIPFNYIFEPKEIYSLQIDFKDTLINKDVILFYIPQKKPFIDNTENIEVLRFYKNNIEDSIGLVFNFNFDFNDSKILETDKIEKERFKIYTDVNYIHIENILSPIRIFDILGKEILFNSNNMKKGEIIINKLELNPGIYLIQDNLKTTRFVLN